MKYIQFRTRTQNFNANARNINENQGILMGNLQQPCSQFSSMNVPAVPVAQILQSGAEASNTSLLHCFFHGIQAPCCSEWSCASLLDSLLSPAAVAQMQSRCGLASGVWIDIGCLDWWSDAWINIRCLDWGLMPGLTSDVCDVLGCLD